MNFRRLGTQELSDFAANIQDVLTGGEIASLDAATRAELLTALGTLPDELASQGAAAMVAEDVRRSMVSERNATRAKIRAVVARVRDTMKANLANSSELARCGFDLAGGRSRYLAQDPTGISAFGFSNGVNRIKFAGNNRPAQVVYEMWRRERDDDVWRLYATTKKQTFTDVNVIPGRHYEYKVRAVAAKTVSNFSDAAVVP